MGLEATEVVGGLGAGLFKVAAGHPLDTVKVRVQASAATGALVVLRRIVQYEGFRALYRGAGLQFGILLGYNATLFATYGLCVRALGEGRNSDTATSVVAGSVAGALVTPLLSPAELVRCRWQVMRSTRRDRLLPSPLPPPPAAAAASSATRAFAARVRTPPRAPPPPTSLWECAQHVVRAGGARALFRGSTLTMGREVIGGAVYFTTYQASVAGLSGGAGGSQSRPWQMFAAGGTAGCLNWALVYPLDLVKTRLQTAPLPGSTGAQAVRGSARREFLRIWQAEGLAGFYRGLQPCLARAFVANGAGFLAFEVVRMAFDRVEAPTARR